MFYLITNNNKYQLLTLIRYRLSSTHYHDILAKPFISNYDDTFPYENAAEDEQPQEQWVVVVPHMHLGSANYGCIEAYILKLMYVTWIRTLILTDIVIALLDDPNYPHDVGTRQFCERVLELWRAQEPEELTTTINQVKREGRDLMSSNARGKKIVII